MSEIIIFLIIALLLIKFIFKAPMCKIQKDLTNRIAVITGGNTGIGRQTALQLAKRNCTVIIGARDRKKSEQAIKYIKSNSKNQNVEYFELDLGSKSSIESFANQIKKKYKSIDYLINNAGVMALPQRQQTLQGFEAQIGINHFGHFYLTYLLFYLFKSSDDLRIINVSSLAHRSKLPISFDVVKINFEDIHFKKSYHWMAAYSQSKLANVMFSKQLGRRIGRINPNARVISLHPGVVRTQLLRYQNIIIRGIVTILKPLYWIFSKSSQEGAQTTLYGIFQKKENLINGGYFADCKIAYSNPQADNQQNCIKLWEVTENAWNIKFKI